MAEETAPVPVTTEAPSVTVNIPDVILAVETPAPQPVAATPDLLGKAAEATNTLSPAVKPLPEPVPLPELKYILVVVPHGEIPYMRVASDPKIIVKELALCVDRDMYVFPIYGLALPLTQGPQCAMILPDGTLLQFHPDCLGTVTPERIGDPNPDYHLGPRYKLVMPTTYFQSVPMLDSPPDDPPELGVGVTR